MARGWLRSLLGGVRSPSRRLTRSARWSLECLDDRALPSAVSVLASVAEVEHVLVDFPADVRALTKTLGTNASSTVSTDLTTVSGDFAKVSADVTSGASAAADLTTLTNDLKKLTTDVGTTGGWTVQFLLHDLSGDTAGLGTALGTLSKGLTGDVSAISNDLTKLTTDLGSNATTQITGDIATVNTALTKVTGDLTAGTSAVADAKALVTAEQTLAKDVGTGLGRTVNSDLWTLGVDVRGLAGDVNGLTAVVGYGVRDVQADAAALATALGSNVSTTVANDLTALNTAITKVATDLSTGVSASADVQAAIGDEATLKADVGTSASPQVSFLLADMSYDWLGVSLVLQTL
jgi:hypothetical protein